MLLDVRMIMTITVKWSNEVMLINKGFYMGPIAPTCAGSATVRSVNDSSLLASTCTVVTNKAGNP